MEQQYKDRWLKFFEWQKKHNYTQGFGRLRDLNNCFCYEGLMCEFYREETGAGRWVKSAGSYFSFIADDVLRDAAAFAVLDYFGILDTEFNVPTLKYKQEGFRFTILDLNDFEKLSFDEINQLIKRQWLGIEETANV